MNFWEMLNEISPYDYSIKNKVTNNTELCRESQMMPTCHYRGCRKVAEVKLGEIRTCEKYGYGKDWPTTVYICKKCRKKILKKLGPRLEKKE